MWNVVFWIIWPHHIYRSQHPCRRPAPAWIFSLGIKSSDRRHARVKAVVVADANTRLIAVPVFYRCSSQTGRGPNSDCCSTCHFIIHVSTWNVVFWIIWPHHIYRSQHSCRRPAPAWIFSLGIKISDRRHARVKAVVVSDANTRIIAVPAFYRCSSQTGRGPDSDCCSTCHFIIPVSTWNVVFWIIWPHHIYRSQHSCRRPASAWIFSLGIKSSDRRHARVKAVVVADANTRLIAVPVFYRCSSQTGWGPNSDCCSTCHFIIHVSTWNVVFWIIWPHHIYRSQHSCRRPAPAWIFSLGIKISDRRHARVKAVVVSDANTRIIAVPAFYRCSSQTGRGPDSDCCSTCHFIIPVSTWNVVFWIIWPHHIYCSQHSCRRPAPVLLFSLGIKSSDRRHARVKAVVVADANTRLIAVPAFY
ncbi:hypothetical protein MRX96_051394, partial [Rhipicephalus microplus]